MNSVEILALTLLFYLVTITLATLFFGIKKVKKKLSVILIQLILLSAAFVFSMTLPPGVDLARLISGIEVGMMFSVILILLIVIQSKHSIKKAIKPNFSTFFLVLILLYLFIKTSATIGFASTFPDFAVPLFYFLMSLGAGIAVYLRGKSVGL